MFTYGPRGQSKTSIILYFQESCTWVCFARQLACDWVPYSFWSYRHHQHVNKINLICSALASPFHFEVVGPYMILCIYGSYAAACNQEPVLAEVAQVVSRYNGFANVVGNCRNPDGLSHMRTAVIYVQLIQARPIVMIAQLHSIQLLGGVTLKKFSVGRACLKLASWR